MAITEWEVCRTAIGKGRINVILCDDDPAFLNALNDELTRIINKLSIAASIILINKPADLTTERLAACDMAFLDIDFDGEDRNGIDIARALREVNGSVLLFFVTNYIDYAPVGFEVQAFRSS